MGHDKRFHYESHSGLGNIIQYRGDRPVSLTSSNEWDYFMSRSQQLANMQQQQQNPAFWQNVHDPHTDTISRFNGITSMIVPAGFNIKQQTVDKLEELYSEKPNVKGNSMMKSFREYLNMHRDMIFTVALVFIADHYLLGGALKSRLQGLLEGILNKAETSLHKEIGK